MHAVELLPRQTLPAPLAAGAARGGSEDQRIPRIIHQSWRDAQLPELFKELRASWVRHHAGWTHKLWTDADNRQLVADHFPWFLPTYDALPKNIMRADAARYMYMFLYGGVYVDLDLECLRPLDPLLQQQHGAVLGSMGADQSYPHSVPNAFLASPPGHPLWLLVLTNIWRNPSRGWFADAEQITGPQMLKETIEGMWAPLLAAPGSGVAASSAGGGGEEAGMQLSGGSAGSSVSGGLPPVALLPPQLIYPYDWHAGSDAEYAACDGRAPTFDRSTCKDLFPRAYAISYWTHTWG